MSSNDVFLNESLAISIAEGLLAAEVPNKTLSIVLKTGVVGGFIDIACSVNRAVFVQLEAAA